MKRRSGEIQVMSLSFLDLICCALGAMILIMIAYMLVSKTAIRDERADGQRFRDENKRLTGQLGELRMVVEQSKKALAGLNAELGSVKEQLGDAQGELAKAQVELDAVKTELKGVVGLKGPMRNVVFLLDISGSLAENKNHRFADPEYPLLVKTWIRNLRFERFNLIAFNREIMPWPRGMGEATVDNRLAAAAFVDQLRPDEATNTIGALKRALVDKPDTIILFTDGIPNIGENGEELDKNRQRAIAQIEDWLAQNAGGTVINVVGYGDYVTDKTYGEFLRGLARRHRGAFIGR